MKIKELEDTTNLMESEDYKERFIAEYYQLKIRCKKLNKLITRIEASRITDNLLEPNHDCPLHLLKEQLYLMREYLQILEKRAIIEWIDLDEVEYE